MSQVTHPLMTYEVYLKLEALSTAETPPLQLWPDPAFAHQIILQPTAKDSSGKKSSRQVAFSCASDCFTCGKISNVEIPFRSNQFRGLLPLSPSDALTLSAATDDLHSWQSYLTQPSNESNHRQMGRIKNIGRDLRPRKTAVAESRVAKRARTPDEKLARLEKQLSKHIRMTCEQYKSAGSNPRAFSDEACNSMSPEQRALVTFCLGADNQPKKLGSGGFGVVYEGVYNGKHKAVKLSKLTSKLGDHLLEVRESMELGQYIRIQQDVVMALEQLHKRGLLHNDLKNENILITIGDGNRIQVKISDLGLTTHEGAQAPVHPGGTPGYMGFGDAELASMARDIFAWAMMVLSHLKHLLWFATGTEVKQIEHLEDLAKSATTEIPEERPTTTQILARLEEIAETLTRTPESPMAEDSVDWYNQSSMYRDTDIRTSYERNDKRARSSGTPAEGACPIKVSCVDPLPDVNPRKRQQFNPEGLNPLWRFKLAAAADNGHNALWRLKLAAKRLQKGPISKVLPSKRSRDDHPEGTPALHEIAMSLHKTAESPQGAPVDPGTPAKHTPSPPTATSVIIDLVSPMRKLTSSDKRPTATIVNLVSREKSTCKRRRKEHSEAPPAKRGHYMSG
eukprot:gene6504-3143_t